MGLFGFDIGKGIRSGVDYVMGPEAQEEEENRGAAPGTAL